MVTPVVCPRLFEFLTTLTVGAQRRNHTVSTAFETITKKTETVKARCPHAISNFGREVRQYWRRCVGCCVAKKMLRL